MELNYSVIEGKSKGYRILLAVLGVLGVAGLAAFFVSYTEGHQVLGSSDAIPWGLPIVLAIYLIGLSAGSLILSSITYIFGRDEYKPIARMAVFLAIVLIFGAMIAIAGDLGRPEKIWRLFTFGYLSNMSSMFAINAILYGGYFVISLVYLGFIFSSRPRGTAIVGMLAVSWAVLVHMGTGAIFGFIAARPTWFSALRPFEFLAAALASGLALLILAVILTLHFNRRPMRKEMLTALGRFLARFVIILLVLVFIDKLTHLYAPDRAATLYMLTGHYSWIFWVFQIGLGATLPLGLLLHPKTGKSITGICLAAMAVVVGVFFERYYLVISGAAYPLPLYPGNIQGIWGTLGFFPITPVEVVLSIGIIASLVLIFVLGLKYLELLPPVKSNSGDPT